MNNQGKEILRFLNDEEKELWEKWISDYLVASLRGCKEYEEESTIQSVDDLILARRQRMGI